MKGGCGLFHLYSTELSCCLPDYIHVISLPLFLGSDSFAMKCMTRGYCNNKGHQRLVLNCRAIYHRISTWQREKWMGHDVVPYLSDTICDHDKVVDLLKKKKNFWLEISRDLVKSRSRVKTEWQCGSTFNHKTITGGHPDGLGTKDHVIGKSPAKVQLGTAHVYSIEIQYIEAFSHKLLLSHIFIQTHLQIQRKVYGRVVLPLPWKQRS